MTDIPKNRPDHTEKDGWLCMEREFRSRIQPPTGFTERVMAEVAREQMSRDRRPSFVLSGIPAKRWRLAGLGIAAALLAAFMLVPHREQEPHRPLCVEESRHMVTLQLAVPGARSVSLVGDFNRWDATASRMDDADGDGTWSITLLITPGRYQYGFVVNGSEWIPDPRARRFAQDGFGGKNAILRI